MFEKEYELEYFKANGFVRRICKRCGTPFWTQNKDEEYCGVAPCVEYGFIDDPITSRKFNVDEVRDAYIRFFSERGHTPLKRYPVVARWRDDIYFTIASIADFQPHVTSGDVEPPANPLVISQPCVRFVDVDNVGKSGRHLTLFEMMGHHAFNYPGKEVYWKDECVEYCHTFLTERLGIDPMSIRYREDPWLGGGNAGPALEVCTSGLEVATLVFMAYRADAEGKVEIKGERFSPMPTRVVDPGYGLERLVWASQGTFTVYDAIYGDIVNSIAEGIEGLSERDKGVMNEYFKVAGLFDIGEKDDINAMRLEALKRLKDRGYDMTLKDLEKMIVPWESVYALADHAKALVFMIGDGAVPSNTKGGYLVRLLIRRALRIMEDLGLKDTSLSDVMDMHIHALKGTYPEFTQVQETIHRIVDVERERYRRTMEKAGPKIRALLERYKGKEIPRSEVLTMYESHGIHPSAIKAAAREMGVDVVVPENVTAMLAERHSGDKGGGEERKESWVTDIEVEIRDRGDIKDTELLYYTNDRALEFKSRVLYSREVKDGWAVVLDATAFYPEGGGQPCDLGTIEYNGNVYKVGGVLKVGGKVVHLLTGGGPIPVGKEVLGKVDKERRMAHTRHHTATHLVINAARRVLGQHVWQTGSQLWEDFARVDITHYERATMEEIRAIERIANTLVLEGHKVTKSFMPREEAERRYGFIIYQGGPPISRTLRIVNIDDIEVEACGGTHVDNTSDIGLIKIKGFERIQDGVLRLEYTAGMATLDYTHRIEDTIRSTAEVFGVPLDSLPRTAKRFFDEWKDYRTQVERLKRYEAAVKLEEMLAQGERVKGGGIEAVIIHAVLDMSINDAKKITEEVSKRDGHIALLGLRDEKGPKLIFARSHDLGSVDLRDVIKAAAAHIDGSGGGKSDFVQGGGTRAEGLEAAINAALERTKALLLGE